MTKTNDDSLTVQEANKIIAEFMGFKTCPVIEAAERLKTVD